jgi:SAM-dependent methyltransferase
MYRHLDRLSRAGEVPFTNYGFAPLAGDGRQPALDAKDEADRFGIQLYHHVAAAVDLSGRDVLEVGCGRGGGASYISRYLGPRAVTGLDLDPGAIAFCRQNVRAPGLSFRAGNSEALPFADGSFDAVVNVESSHCYGSMRDFLREVRRVLRPGGFFLFADFRTRALTPRLHGQLERAGFRFVSEHSITANVFAALDRDSRRKLALIRRRVPPLLRPLFCQFAATEGTATYEAFHTGAWEYRSYVLAPPAA